MVEQDARGQRPRRSDSVAEELRRHIAEGRYQPNTFLPSERKLAANYAASRTTIADALAQLESDGLIARVHGRGTQVTAPLPAGQNAVIRLIHPLNPRKRIVWGESFEIMRGIEEAAASMNYQLERHCYTSGDASSRTFFPEDMGPTVFLEAGGENEPYIKQLEAAGVPCSVANLEQARMPYTGTKVDHADASRRAVKLLAQMGHRRIAYIGTERSLLFYADCLRGYCEGLAQAGLDIDPALIMEFTVIGMSRVLCGYCGAQRLLARDDRPTAIVAARDMYAEGAWHAIEHGGLEVGTDVSLIGYDDLSWSYYSEGVPPLTTFKEPCFEMGRKAVELLVDRIANGNKPHEQIVLESQLIMRRSVGPVPRRVRKASFDMPFDDIGVVNRGIEHHTGDTHEM